MGNPVHKPVASRRLAASCAIVLVVLVVVSTLLDVLDHPMRLLVVVALLAVATAALWYAISRAGPVRHVAVATGIAAVVGLIAIGLFAPGSTLAIRFGILVVAVLLGRYALHRDVRTLKRLETPGAPVPAATHGVLIMNLRSGGGKAARFHLEDECSRRGIEPVVLGPGDDLRQLARDAIDRGADVIGMAGGDGSQALVASVAAERGVPMVVVPAGTRNHLALDLGLDRAAVLDSLDAFGEAVEITIDLAEVNGRTFVNNVSLGLYAEIVRSPEYRDAKVDTTLAALPQLLGVGSQPFALGFEDPGGERHSSVHVIQVSNGPYGTTLGGFGTRPRLDTGLLGIATLVIPDDRAGRRFLRALATGRPDRYEGLTAWAAPTFRVTARAPISVGLDGETVELEPPLEFCSRPGVLRIRLPKRAIGYSPAALAPRWRSVIPDLWRTALGRPIAIEA